MRDLGVDDQRIGGGAGAMIRHGDLFDVLPERETLSPALREQIIKDATGVAGDHGSTDCVGHGDPVAPFCKTMRAGHPLCDDLRLAGHST